MITTIALGIVLAMIILYFTPIIFGLIILGFYSLWQLFISVLGFILQSIADLINKEKE